jgi:hypothetical protein
MEKFMSSFTMTVHHAPNSYLLVIAVDSSKVFLTMRALLWAMDNLIKPEFDQEVLLHVEDTL